MLTLGISLAGAVPATAQAPAVPLGQAAARFGLVSGQTLTVGTGTPTHSVGSIGSVGAISGSVVADSGVYQAGAPLLSQALAAVTAARTFCSAQSGQPMATFSSQPLAPGVYAVSGSATLAAGTVWTLSGGPNDVYIFNISGSLTLNDQAFVVSGGVAPRNVYWNIGGNLESATAAGLPGVVLLGGSATVAGTWTGETALLAAGAVTLSGLDAQTSVGTFPNPNGMWLLRIPQPPPVPTGGGCSNLISNGSFESPTPGVTAPTRLGNFGTSSAACAATGSEVAAWSNANLASPDWFRAGSPNPPNLGVPTNQYGSATPRSATDQSYAGVYAFAGQRGDREYMYQTLAAALLPRPYYVEMYSRLATSSSFGLPSLGIRFDDECPWQSRNTTLLDAANQPLPAHVSAREATFNDVTQWSRTSGVYVAVGGEQYLTIGRFGQPTATGFVSGVTGLTGIYNGACYYIDEVSLFAFPQPVIAQQPTPPCRVSAFVLTVDCPLPATAGATYQWTNTATGQVVGSGSGPVNVFPLASTSYTLTIRTQNADGSLSAPYQQTVQAVVPNAPTILAGTYVGGRIFPSGTYRVLAGTNVRFTQGDYIFRPGSVVMVEPEVDFIVGQQGQLIAEATTFTAACNQLWNGIFVATDARGLVVGRAADRLTTALPATAAYGQQNPVSEISHATVAVQWANPAQVPVRLLHTLVKNNAQGVLSLSAVGGSGVVAASAAIVNCDFDSYSSQMRTGNPDDYTHVALNLDGWNYKQMTVAGNRFRRCIVGVLLRNQQSGAAITLADRNEFMALMVGVWAQDVAGGLTVNGNRFSYDYPYPTQYAISANLMTRFHNRFPGINTGLNNRYTGLYVQGSYTPASGTLTVQANDFRQGVVTNSFPATWAYPQRGAVLNCVNGKYLILNNLFENVETALRIGLRHLGDAQSKVASNRFYNNSQNIVLHSTGGPPLTGTPVFWPQCNTFRRTVNSTTASTAIRVESGTFIFDSWEDQVSGSGWKEFMKNRFDDQTGTNQRMRYLSNANRATIRYTAYETQDANLSYNINLRPELRLAARNTGFDVTQSSNTSITSYIHDYSCLVADGLDDGFNLPRTSQEPVPATTDDTAPQAHESFVGAASPNPVADEAHVALRLPAGTMQAQLLVREVQTGQVVGRHSLRAAAQEATIPVGHLRDGVYTYSVVADGVVLGTKRLLVSHAAR